MPTSTYTLSNGLRVIARRMDSDVVYCGYSIKAGARNEEKGEEGLAHFCEHMTFKGTETLSPLKIINALDSVGGELNAYTAKEETCYYAAIMKQHFKKAVNLLTDIVFNSTYPQVEIEKECEVVCDEIESYRDSPAELIYDDFENEMFGAKADANSSADGFISSADSMMLGSRASLGHNVLGDKDTVRSFTTADCQRFTSRLYTPDRAVFYVLGDVDVEKVIPLLEKTPSSSLLQVDTSLHESNQCHIKLPPSGVLGRGSSNSLITKSMDTHQAHVMMGTVITDQIEDWRMPLYLANNILGGPSMNSRLNISLREKRGLVYTVESLMTSYTDTLLWTTYFGCDHHDVRRCMRLVNSELQRLRKAPLSLSRLNAAKQQIKGQITLAAQNSENYAIDMAKQFLHYNKVKDYQRLFRKIDSVTPEQIHALMNEVLTEDRLLTLIYS